MVANYDRGDPRKMILDPLLRYVAQNNCNLYVCAVVRKSFSRSLVVRRFRYVFFFLNCLNSHTNRSFSYFRNWKRTLWTTPAGRKESWYFSTACRKWAARRSWRYCGCCRWRTSSCSTRTTCRGSRPSDWPNPNRWVHRDNRCDCVGGARPLH